MAGFLDGMEVNVPCPGCGHETAKSIGWLKSHDHLTCEGCGETVELQDEGLREGLARAEKQIAALTKGLK